MAGAFNEVRGSVNLMTAVTTREHDLAGQGDRVGRRLLVQSLLACGVAALVLYVLMDAVAALRYEGYSYRDQTISELSAIDAPTRSFWLPFAFAYEALVIALAAGVFAVAGNKRSLRVIAWAILIHAVLGLVWPFAPMHQREVLAADGSTWSDTLHLVLAGVTSVAFFAMIVAGIVGFRGAFRVYSVATIVLLAVFGSLVSLNAGGVADNDSTPWIGVFERINVFGAMLWMAVLAVVLLRAPTGSKSAAQQEVTR